jgi:tetratricopeptide (TPR) repeat protein
MTRVSLLARRLATMRHLLCSAGLLGVLMGPCVSLAQSPGGLSFADTLFEEGDYFRAITEYRRAIHESEDGAGSNELWFLIGQSYLRAKRYSEAMEVFSRLVKLETDTTLQRRSRYQMGMTYLMAGTSHSARKEFLALLEEPDDAGFRKDRTTLALAATWFQERDWEQAAATLEGFEESHPGSALLETAALVKANALAAEDLPRKSPFLAGLLSAVVPGLGQFYEGRWGDGIQALLITGVFGAATAASLYAEYHNNYSDYVVPSLVGSGFLVFYGANIYGAVNGARMSNIMASHRHVKETQDIYLPVLQ